MRQVGPRPGHAARCNSPCASRNASTPSLFSLLSLVFPHTQLGPCLPTSTHTELVASQLVAQHPVSVGSSVQACVLTSAAFALLPRVCTQAFPDYHVLVGLGKSTIERYLQVGWRSCVLLPQSRVLC